MRSFLFAAIVFVLVAIIYVGTLKTQTECPRKAPGIKLMVDAHYIEACLSFFVQLSGRFPKLIGDLIPYCLDLTPQVEPQNFRDQWNNPYRILYTQDRIQIVTSNAGGDKHRYSNYVILEKKLKSLAWK